MGGFKSLEAYGIDLKRQHRNKIRKYIKFDDTEEDLFLQVKHDGDDDWLNFTPAEAKRALQAKNEKKIRRSNIHRSPRPGDLPPAPGAAAGGARAKKPSNATNDLNADEEDAEEMEQEVEQQRNKWNPPPRC